jgi:hypothetical protein
MINPAAPEGSIALTQAGSDGFTVTPKADASAPAVAGQRVPDAGGVVARGQAGTRVQTQDEGGGGSDHAKKTEGAEQASDFGGERKRKTAWKKEEENPVSEIKGTSAELGNALRRIAERLQHSQLKLSIEDEQVLKIIESMTGVKIDPNKPLPAVSAFKFDNLSFLEKQQLDSYLYVQNILMAATVGEKLRQYQTQDMLAKEAALPQKGKLGRIVDKGKEFIKTYITKKLKDPSVTAEDILVGMYGDTAQNPSAPEDRRKLLKQVQVLSDMPELDFDKSYFSSAGMATFAGQSFDNMCQELLDLRKARKYLVGSLRGKTSIGQITNVESIVPHRVEVRLSEVRKTSGETGSPQDVLADRLKESIRVVREVAEQRALGIVRKDHEGVTGEKEGKLAELMDSFKDLHDKGAEGGSIDPDLKRKREDAEKQYKDADKESKKKDALYLKAEQKLTNLRTEETTLPGEIQNIDDQIKALLKVLEEEAKSKITTSTNSAELTRLRARRDTLSDRLNALRNTLINEQVQSVHDLDTEKAELKQKAIDLKDIFDKLPSFTEIPPEFKKTVDGLWEVVKDEGGLKHKLNERFVTEASSLDLLKHDEVLYAENIGVIRHWFGLDGPAFNKLVGDQGQYLVALLAKRFNIPVSDAAKLENADAKVLQEVTARLVEHFSIHKQESLQQLAQEDIWPTAMRACISADAVGKYDVVRIDQGYKYEGDELEGRKIEGLFKEQVLPPFMEKVLARHGIIPGVNSTAEYIRLPATAEYPHERRFAVAVNPESGENIVVDEAGRILGHLAHTIYRAGSAISMESPSSAALEQTGIGDGISMILGANKVLLDAVRIYNAGARVILIDGVSVALSKGTDGKLSFGSKSFDEWRKDAEINHKKFLLGEARPYVNGLEKRSRELRDLQTQAGKIVIQSDSQYQWTKDSATPGDPMYHKAARVTMEGGKAKIAFYRSLDTGNPYWDEELVLDASMPQPLLDDVKILTAGSPEEKIYQSVMEAAFYSMVDSGKRIPEAYNKMKGLWTVIGGKEYGVGLNGVLVVRDPILDTQKPLLERLNQGVILSELTSDELKTIRVELGRKYFMAIQEAQQEGQLKRLNKVFGEKQVRAA